MNPYKLSQVYKQLTSQNSILKKYLKLGTKDLKQPDLPAFVETKNAVNRFVRDNPRPDQLGRKDMAGGGSIGGGNIEGTPIGNRTGFENVFLKQGKKSRFGPGTDTIVIEGKEYRRISDKNNPNFGKYSFRESVSTGERYPSGRIKSKEKTTYYTEKQLRDRIAKGSFTGKALYKSYTPGYLAELKDIKNFVDDKGAKNIFLSDLVKMFGDETKETGDTEQVRDATTEKKIKRAIGDDEYKKLIKGGDRAKTTIQKKRDFNALVKAVKRGEKPLIALSSEMTGEAPNVFKSYLNKVELRMYNEMMPKVRAIVSRVTQPRQIYEGTNAVEELKNTTTKTYNRIMKKYPVSSAARNIITTGKGIIAYNDRSYILSQLFRHVQNGGTKYSYVSGNTTATIKFRNNKTGKLITLNNIDVNSPEFKEAADAYNQKEKIMNTEIDDPRKKGSKIKIGQAIAANGDSIVIDHLDDVKNNPLKNLTITNQKANIAATIKGATEAELKSIGRGVKLSLEDNIKRYSNYAKRVLIDPESKRPPPKETIFKKTGTLRGVTDPPDLEIKKFLASMGRGSCSVQFGGTDSPALKAEGGRIGYKVGTKGIDQCAEEGALLINSGMKNANSTQLKNFAAFANRAKNLGRNIMKFGIIPEAMYVAADATIRLTMGDKPTEALLRASEYLLPGDQTKLAKVIQAKRVMNPEVAAIIDRSIDYKNKLSEIESLKSQKDNLENLSGGGEFDYIGDLNQDSLNLDKLIKQKENALNTKFKMTDAELTYADAMQDEIQDRIKSGSFLTKVKSIAQGIGDREYGDVETLGVPEKTQEQLNKRMTPQFDRDLLLATEAEMIRAAKTAQAQGYDIPDDYYIKEKLKTKNLIQNMSLAELAAATSPELVYGAQGHLGEPLNKGVVEKPQNIISDMEREITGQTNVANPFDIDLSMMGSGLRGFSAAGGGIAKEAGVDSGAPPESGPNSQGLSYLMKRGKNI